MTTIRACLFEGRPKHLPAYMSSQTTQSNALIDFLAWIEVNKKRLILVASVIAALALVISLYRWYSQERERSASRALSSLRPSPDAAPVAAAPQVQAYLDLAKTYPRTSAGAHAFLLAAAGLFKEGKYQEALDHFQKFVREHGDNSFAPEAAFGVAASLDALNRVDEALKQYEEVVKRYPNSAPVNQAKLAMARLYESKGQNAMALKLYEELARDKAPSQWVAEARARREQLQQQAETSGTNAAPITAPKS
jgi:predicted negative regulator of RcsB-dependent stress response